MRKIAIYSLLSALLVGFGTGADAQENASIKTIKDPSVAHINREIPRSLVESFSSQEAALKGDVAASLYIQPLTEFKNRTEGKTVIHEQQFKMPFAWANRQMFLHLDATDCDIEIFVNDNFVGATQSNGVPVEFDVTNYSVEGNNKLRIVAHTDGLSRSLESFRERTTGMLTGDNYILSQPKIRIRDYETEAKIEGDQGIFTLGVAMKTHLLNSKDVKVYYELFSPEGESVAKGNTEVKFNMRGESVVYFSGNVRNVRSWSHEEPNLYKVAIKTQHEGRFMEYTSFDVGFRTFTFDNENFLVNGTPIEIVCVPYNGRGEVEKQRDGLTNLKNKGVNCIKINERPQSEHFYRLCDQLGLYIIDQAAINSRSSGSSITKGGNVSNNPIWENRFTDRVEAMYHHSKNHPSVAMFSIAEESANGYNLYRSYLALKELESLRPIVYLHAGGEWNSDAATAERKAPKPLTGKTIYAQEIRQINLPSFTSADNVSSNGKAPEELKVEIVDAAKGVVRITNQNNLKIFSNIDVTTTVKSGKKVLKSEITTINLVPLESRMIEVPMTNLDVKSGKKIEVTVEVTESARPTFYTYSPQFQDVEKQGITSFILDRKPDKGVVLGAANGTFVK